MAARTWLGLTALVVLCACNAKKSVDPAYLATLTDGAKEMCACAKLEDAAAAEKCKKGVAEMPTMGPDGQFALPYEKGLKNDDRHQVELANEQRYGCEKSINERIAEARRKDGGG